METITKPQLSAAIPAPLNRILQDEPCLTRAYLVGGFVRDGLLNQASKDIDIEVFGVSFEDLAVALRKWGRVDLVGKSFGVIKLTPPGCATVDVAIPRTESKTAPGHRGFEASFDPLMSLTEASRRRDFSLNALFYDPRERCVIDCHGGLQDLQDGVLRMVDSDTFADDPLRVLRAMQFIARFDLRGDPSLVNQSAAIKASFLELASERVCDEWTKWASQCLVPSRGLVFLRDCGWLDHFPELAAMRGVPQDPEWHPEGDVFQHTLHCCDALAQLEEWRRLSREDRIVSMLAVLLHDIGKATTTQKVERGGRMRIISPGHESVSAREAAVFLRQMGFSNAIQDRVIPLIANHMIHLQSPSDRAVRRLAHRLQPETIEGLCLVMKADSFGRPPKPKVLPQTVSALLSHSKRLTLSQGAPQPLILGRDLLKLGQEPGPALGRRLKQLFEAQLDGVFQDKAGGLQWLAQHELEKEEGRSS